MFGHVWIVSIDSVWTCRMPMMHHGQVQSRIRGHLKVKSLPLSFKETSGGSRASAGWCAMNLWSQWSQNQNSNNASIFCNDFFCVLCAAWMVSCFDTVFITPMFFISTVCSTLTEMNVFVWFSMCADTMSAKTIQKHIKDIYIKRGQCVYFPSGSLFLYPLWNMVFTSSFANCWLNHS